jgi:dipeptidyl aminopeptidase/acylaminoacyl peptidase
MTSWVVTQTKRFKAASAGAPRNEPDELQTALPTYRRSLPDYFGGQAWEIMDLYQKHSPMFNVKGVSTPHE